MILESLVTTCDVVGAVNLAPMGPLVDDALTQFTLRPFRPSRTYDNLASTRRAVIHVVDDVLLLARAVTNELSQLPPLRPLDNGRWHILEDACRYFVVEVDQWVDDPLRANARCRVIEEGQQRPFFGFNRAKHAVIEAAILSTRTHLLAADSIRQQLEWLRPWVEKTGGQDEHQAWEIVVQAIEAKLGQERISRATEK